MPTPASPDAQQKKPYTTPVLSTYGEVGVLTQSGSASGTEGTTSGDKNFKAASDRRLKDNIVQVGTHPMGIGLYLFNYKSEFKARLGDQRQFGVMADEVETLMPQAVSTDDHGFKQVDYAMLGIRPTVH